MKIETKRSERFINYLPIVSMISNRDQEAAIFLDPPRTDYMLYDMDYDMDSGLSVHRRLRITKL